MPGSIFEEQLELRSPLGRIKTVESLRGKCLPSLDEDVLRILRTYSPPQELFEHISRPLFEDKVRSAVKSGQPIHMVLPAFPFKSPNNQDKTLGVLPDLGEEIALARLEGLCVDLERRIGRETKLSIVSDGLVYSDLLGVSEETVWNYGNALRKLAAAKFPHIRFARLSHLSASKTSESLQEYQDSAVSEREKMVKQHLPVDFDVKTHLDSDISALMTYRGYCKFLLTDLAHIRKGESKSAAKKKNEVIAKKMIVRGTAFSNAVIAAFPTAIRLSIHASKDTRKLPISLFPGNNTFITPWHTACAFNVDGSVTFEHKSTLSANPKYELVYRDDRPSHFQEISDFYSWAGTEIAVNPIYPCGIIITPKISSNEKPSVEAVDMLKIRSLAEINSPVVLRGFATPDRARETFVSKAREMGPIMPWKFGEVLVVKDGGSEGGGLNNVLSAEPMPFHFDGLFKTALAVGKDGQKRLIPQPPRFQVFTARTPSPPNTGYTLITSSRLLFKSLPIPWTTEDLQKLTWGCETTSFNATKLDHLPLVVPHPNPNIKSPCLRYHEPWGPEKTTFDPTIMRLAGPGVIGDGKEVMAMIDELLYDRRNCYYHNWEKGDWLINDNIAMMHTRSGFVSGAERELWRVHVD